MPFANPPMTKSFDLTEESYAVYSDFIPGQKERQKFVVRWPDGHPKLAELPTDAAKMRYARKCMKEQWPGAKIEVGYEIYRA